MNEEGAGKGGVGRKGRGQGQQQPGFTRPRGLARRASRLSGIPAAPCLPPRRPQAGRARAAGPAPGEPRVRGRGPPRAAQSGLARASRRPGSQRVPPAAQSRRLFGRRQGGGATRGRGQARSGDLRQAGKEAVGRHFGRRAVEGGRVLRRSGKETAGGGAGAPRPTHRGGESGVACHCSWRAALERSMGNSGSPRAALSCSLRGCVFEGRRCESKGPSQRRGVLEAAPVLSWGYRALPARGLGRRGAGEARSGTRSLLPF